MNTAGDFFGSAGTARKRRDRKSKSSSRMNTDDTDLQIQNWLIELFDPCKSVFSVVRFGVFGQSCPAISFFCACKTRVFGMDQKSRNGHCYQATL